MITDKNILGIITARGGSKGLPKKNILPLNGKPLIAWTIESALKSKYLDRIILSTDNQEIADVSSKFGCEVPFIRPDNLAEDNSSSFDVIAHAIQYFNDINQSFDYIILLEPTSPLRETSDIDHAIQILHKNRKIADSIVGVSKVESTHPVFDVKINKNGLIQSYLDESFTIYRRQDLEELYFFEGTIYVSDTKALLREQKFYHARTLPYIVPKWKSIEIDEEIDMIIAEAILKNKLGR